MCSRSTSARSQGVPNVGTPSYSVPVQRQPVPKVFPMRSHAIILMHDLAGILTAFPRCFRAQRVPVIPFFLKLPRCSRGVPVAQVFSRSSRSTSARSHGVPNVGTPSYSVPVQRQPVPKVFPMWEHRPIVYPFNVSPFPRCSQCVPMPKAFPRCSQGLLQTFKAFPCPRHPHGVPTVFPRPTRSRDLKL